MALPTRSSASWNTELSLSIELVYRQLIYPHKFATPTLRLLLRFMKRDRLGPDMTFGWNVIYKHFSPSLATEAQEFAAPSIDNITRMQYTPALMYNSAGTNHVRMALYDSPSARMNFINLMVDSMHQGYTDAFAYSLFSMWSESLTGGRVDISSALSSAPVPPEELYLNNVSDHTLRMLSIPMLIRDPSATGHTLGNIPVTATTNYWWHPTVLNNSLATVTKSTTAANYDCVTSVTNAQSFDQDDLAEFFDSMQLGWHYGLYCACPAAFYRQLRAITLGMTLRDIASPLADLGIKPRITLEEYNAEFYKEPMMTWLHPYSMFAWDPNCMFLLSDARFDPSGGTGIYEWERISGTNMLATAMYHIVQLLTPDRRGLGAMHGYTNS